ncbi:MAG: sensor histidine kinase [Promethearchaeota archaeon]
MKIYRNNSNVITGGSSSTFNRSNFYKDMLAHNMNNILNCINLAVDFLSRCKINSNNLEIFEGNVDIIKRSVNRAEKLISTVNKLSEIEDSSILNHNIDSKILLYEAINNIRNNFQDKIIDIQVFFNSSNVQVKANELLLDIFENILENALKYNNASIVKIEILVTDMKDDDRNYLKFEFIDNGIGVPESSKEAIMEEGYKKKSDIRGLGIGLSLVKKAIESYQGKFWVEDKVKGDHTQGSNFVILIPKSYIIMK